MPKRSTSVQLQSMKEVIEPGRSAAEVGSYREQRPGSGLGARGSGLRAPGSGLRALRSALRAQGSVLRAPGTELRAPRSELRTLGTLFRRVPLLLGPAQTNRGTDSATSNDVDIFTQHRVRWWSFTVASEFSKHPL